MDTVPPTSDCEPSSGVFFGLSRYDVHLLGIPLAVLVSVLAHLVVGLALQTTLTAASLLSSLVIADAVFLHPPTRRRGAV